MNNYIKKTLVCFSVFTLLILGGCEQTEEIPVVEEVKIISNDVYEVPKNPTQEQVVIFNQLSNALTTNTEDSDIASLVAVNFAYNFYSLYGKESKSDIGGLQFLPEISREDFASYASYKYYHNYDAVITNYSKDDLPRVMTHVVKNVNPAKITYNQLIYDGFEVSLTLNYEESKLGPETLKTNITMQVINNNGLYQVIAAED